MIIIALALAATPQLTPAEEALFRGPTNSLTYSVCVLAKTVEYERTSEPASVVVDAAMGACAAERLVVQRDLNISTGYRRPKEVEKELSRVDEEARRSALSYVLDIRKK